MTTLFANPFAEISNRLPVPFTGGGSSIVSAPAPNDYRRYAGAYMKNEIVFSAIEMLATSAGEPHIVGRKWTRNSPQIRNEEQRLLSCGLTRRDVKATLIRNGFFKDLPGHPLIQLLDNPNPWMSRGQQWGTVVMDRALAGNAYLLKSRWQDGPLKGAVAELWRLRPDRVRIIPSKTTFIEGYEYGVGGRAEDKIIFPPEDVIHFKTRNPLDDYYGMPPLMVISGRIAIDEYMQGFLRTFFEHGGTGPGSILTVKQHMDQKDKDAIRERFRRQFGAQGGFHEMMVLDNAETSYQPLGLDRGLRDALPKELDAMTEARIAMVFGIPASILGLLIGMEASSYANKRSDWQVFWDLTMTPLLSDFDDVLNLQLVPDFGNIDEVVFDMSDIRALQEDVDKMHERVRHDVAGGLQTWEEGREAIGLDPDITEGILLVPNLSIATPVEKLGEVVLPELRRDLQTVDEAEEPEKVPEATDILPAIIAEVSCPKCGRWLGRNLPVGATVHCPNDKEIIVGQAEPVTTVKTVHRDNNGRIAEVVEVTS